MSEPDLVGDLVGEYFPEESGSASDSVYDDGDLYDDEGDVPKPVNAELESVLALTTDGNVGRHARPGLRPFAARRCRPRADHAGCL